jgi:hypothetical protein
VGEDVSISRRSGESVVVTGADDGCFLEGVASPTISSDASESLSSSDRMIMLLPGFIVTFKALGDSIALAKMDAGLQTEARSSRALN